MAEVIKSLFGIDPSEVLAQREAAAQSRALGYAQLAPMQQAMYGASMAGHRMGDFAGGLMGAQDPELVKVSQRQKLIQGLDWSDPEALKSAAQRAAASGDTKAAMELMQTADSVASKRLAMGVQQSQIVKNLREPDLDMKLFMEMAKRATPKSVAAARAAGNDINLLDVPESDKISVYGRMLMEAGYQPGTPEFAERMGKFVNAKLEGAAKGSGNATIINNMPGAGIDPKKTAEAAAKPVGEAIANIEKQWQAVDSVRDAIKAVDEGIFSGFWGKSKMNVRKAFGENDPRVVRTEKFLSDIGNVVIPRLAEFGGNDSVEEMKYLQKVMAGEISLESDAIKEILRSAEQKIIRGIERTQRQSKAAATGQPAPLDPGSRQAPAGTKENPIKLK